MYRQGAQERYEKLKQQLQAEKQKHKSDVETLNDKLLEAKQISNKAVSKVSKDKDKIVVKTLNFRKSDRKGKKPKWQQM